MSLWRAGQVGRIQGLLEAQAHANPNLENLSLHAGEDAGAKCNIDAPGHHHAAQMTAHQRIVSAPLFFPRREVHMVSVWLSLNRVTSRNAETLPDIQVLESDKQVWRHPRMIQHSPVHQRFTDVVHRRALRGAIHEGVLLPLIGFEAALTAMHASTVAIKTSRIVVEPTSITLRSGWFVNI